jgi:hypothetical protein
MNLKDKKINELESKIVSYKWIDKIYQGNLIIFISKKHPNS